jgi:hypothetical protein
VSVVRATLIKPSFTSITAALMVVVPRVDGEYRAILSRCEHLCTFAIRFSLWLVGGVSALGDYNNHNAADKASVIRTVDSRNRLSKLLLSWFTNAQMCIPLAAGRKVE